MSRYDFERAKGRAWREFLNAEEIGLPAYCRTFRPLSHLAPGCVTFDTELEEPKEIADTVWALTDKGDFHLKFSRAKFAQCVGVWYGTRVPFKVHRGTPLNFLVPGRGFAVIADDCFVADDASISSGVYGESTEIHSGAMIDSLVRVSHSCIVGRNSIICAGSVLGGWVEVGQEAFIGLNATVLPHVKIGAGALIGAGSVVTKDVPAGVRAWGVPCRVEGER